MPRTRQHPDVRRAALLDATVACLVQRGPTGLTTRAIAAEAGVSPGLLSYYFKDKEELLAAAFRHLSELLREAEEQAIAGAADDPMERLRAFLLAGFREPFLGTPHLRARVAFWSLAATDPEFAVAHNEMYVSYKRKLADLIEPLVPGISPEDRTISALSAMLDGLWLEHAVGRAQGRDPDTVIETGIALVQAAIAFAAL
jgi:TetR/AcrR family transcriptional regulator, transcriptional repressor of bet genes